MDYLSNRIDDIKKKFKELEISKESPEYKLINEAIALLGDVSAQQDLANNRIAELEESMDQLYENMRDVQELLIKTLDADEWTPSSEKEDEAQDENERIDDFYTVQCPFCEMLFIIEKNEIDEDIECPYCNKMFSASENIVKQ